MTKKICLPGKPARLLILMLLFFAAPAPVADAAARLAPQVKWQICLGGADVDSARSIQQTGDGGFIVAGRTSSSDGDMSKNHGYYDALVVKLNASGAVEWQKCLGGSGNDYAYSIQQTGDGGYIVAGETWSNDGDVSEYKGDGDAWVVKLNALGAIEWQKCLGGSEYDRAYSIQQTGDGGYIVAGETWSNDGVVSGYIGGGDAWVVKLDSSGAIVWQKCLGGTSWDYANSVQQTRDGGYIVAGVTYSSDRDVSGYKDYGDAWVVKLSASSAIEWQKCLGGSHWDSARSVRQTSDAGYIVAGYTESSDRDVSGYKGDGDAWVIKLNASGAIEWQKCLGGSDWDCANSVRQTGDGGYIVAGDTCSNDGDVSGFLGNADAWVVKLDRYGGIEWQKCLGGSGWDYADSTQQTGDDGYIVAGYTNSNDGDVTEYKGGGDAWVVKLDSPPTMTITSFILAGVTGAIDENAGTIAVTVPYGTNVTSLTPTISHTGASISPTGARSFIYPVTYTVTAADNTTKAYTVTVTIAPGNTVTLSVSFQSRTTGSAANEEKLTVKWIKGGAVIDTEEVPTNQEGKASLSLP